MNKIALISLFMVSIILITLIIFQNNKCMNIVSSNYNATTLLGISKSSNFITKTISLLAFLFFLINIIIGNIYSTKCSITGTLVPLTYSSSKNKVSGNIKAKIKHTEIVNKN